MKYTVKKGDSLSKIAIAFGQPALAYKDLYTLNKRIIGANPDRIYPGQVLEIPLAWSKSPIVPVVPDTAPSTPKLPLWLGLGAVALILYLRRKKAF